MDGSLQKKVSHTSNHFLFYFSVCFVLAMHSYNVTLYSIIGVKVLGVVIDVMF